MTYKEDLIKRTAEKMGKSEKVVADIIHHHYKYLETLAIDEDTYAMKIPHIGTLSLNYLASKSVQKRYMTDIQRRIYDKARDMKGVIPMSSYNFVTPYFIRAYMEDNWDFLKDGMRQLKPLYEEYAKRGNKLANEYFFGT